MFKKTLKEYNTILCDGITELLGCEVVKSNVTGHIPDYPYVSFTMTSLNVEGRTYGNDGEQRFMPATVTYSWTIQHSDDYAAWSLAQKLHDWFDVTGKLFFDDNGMVAASVGPIQERDNMLTIEYEFRKGFDVVMNFMNIVPLEKEEIETFNPEYV